MIDRKKRSRKAQHEITDYIGLVDRTVLSYSINYYQAKWEDLQPYSRTLHLYGKMVHPMVGTPMNALLVGDSALAERPANPPGKHVGSLHKHGGEYQFFAHVPLEFISTLSAAFCDNRLQLVYGRGDKLFRGHALLTYIGFHERKSFEADWGEALEG